MVAVALTAVAGVTAASFGVVERTIAQERRTKVRSLVDAVDQVVTEYARLAEQRALGRADAEQAVIRMIRALPAPDGQYFWIVDLHPRIVVHAASPEFDGKDVSGGWAAADNPFPRFVEAARADPAGRFVEYRWPRPGGGPAVRKVSFVKLNPAWGWIVGAGLYLDDVEAAAAGRRREALAGLGVVALLLVVAVALVERSTRRAAHSMEREAAAYERARLAEELADSERRRLEAERLAEIGRLTAEIAHEVNSPLAVVKSNLSWLRECAAAPNHGQEAPDVISEALGSVDRIAAIVASLGGSALLAAPRPPVSCGPPRADEPS